jgi:hypothetical protein
MVSQQSITKSLLTSGINDKLSVETCGIEETLRDGDSIKSSHLCMAVIPSLHSLISMKDKDFLTYWCQVSHPLLYKIIGSYFIFIPFVVLSVQDV